MKTLRIATRASKLALWQANYVKNMLRYYYPALQVELVEVTTKGDVIQDKALADVGGKGLFIKNLEQALTEERADIAVHSLKDVPAVLSEGFCLAATPDRESPWDALVSIHYANVEGLPVGAIVGTASPRRRAQLLYLRPDLKIELLRGNVDTRLRKLKEGQYDAIILAVAGLHRLGFASYIRQTLPKEMMLPSVGQGALGVEVLSSRQDLIEILKPIHDAKVYTAISAERSCVAALNGDCHSPIGAYAYFINNQLVLEACVLDTKGMQKLIHAHMDPALTPEALGQTVAEALLAQGASGLLKQ